MPNLKTDAIAISKRMGRDDAIKALIEASRMPQRTHHLTNIPNSTLIAWHSDHDVQAVRTEAGEERLYVNGKHVPLHPSMHNPVQMVINFCSGGQSPEMLVAQIRA